MHETIGRKRKKTTTLGYFCTALQQYRDITIPLNQHNTTLVVDVERWVDHVDDVKVTADPLSDRLYSPPSAPSSYFLSSSGVP